MVPVPNAETGSEEDMREALLETILLGFLGACAWQDHRERRISVRMLLLAGILGVILDLWLLETTVMELIWGVLPGIALLAVSWASRGEIGAGDGLMVMVMGVYLGAGSVLGVFFCASVFAGIMGFILLFFYKKKRDHEMPFAPFLLAAYVLGLALGV